MAHLWPFFDLVVHTPLLTLKIPNDDELVQLADVIRDGLHDPGWMPFDDPPWTDEPSPDRERGWLVRQWQGRTAITPDQWRLRFGAFTPDGDALGMQDVLASRFPALRAVSTYSWLGERHQGQGLGKEMRRAVLHLAFEGLGAVRAESIAFDDNLASAGVSRSLGYVENGREWDLRRGRPDRATRFLLEVEHWKAPADVAIEGLEPCLPLLGLEG